MLPLFTSFHWKVLVEYIYIKKKKGIDDILVHLELNRIANFWANALHKDVFPVPGGPCNRIMLQIYKGL